MRLCALLVVVLSCTSVARAEEPEAVRQYKIKLIVSDGKADAKPGDPSIQVVSKPTLITLDGKDCWLKIGGEVLLPGFGSNAVEYADSGTQIHIMCHRVDDESVRLKLNMTQTKTTKNEPESYRQSQTGSLVMLKTKLNTPVKTILNEKDKLATWVEVEVEEMAMSE